MNRFRIVWLGLLALGAFAITGAVAASGDPTSVGLPQRAGWGMMSSRYPVAMMSSQPYAAAPRSKLNINQAERRIQMFMQQYGNPRLAIDEVVEFQWNFYGVVDDLSTGHGAFEVLVNKWTAWVSLEYGPAMMWNTKYGMMLGGMMGYQSNSGPMSVGPARAAQIARGWLARYRPGMVAETPDQFPGYYTVHFGSHGRMAGMLSVNGYSGQVWIHTWHGKFIRLKVVRG